MNKFVKLTTLLVALSGLISFFALEKTRMSDLLDAAMPISVKIDECDKVPALYVGENFSFHSSEDVGYEMELLGHGNRAPPSLTDDKAYFIINFRKTPNEVFPELAKGSKWLSITAQIGDSIAKTYFCSQIESLIWKGQTKLYGLGFSREDFASQVVPCEGKKIQAKIKVVAQDKDDKTKRFSTSQEFSFIVPKEEDRSPKKSSLSSSIDDVLDEEAVDVAASELTGLRAQSSSSSKKLQLKVENVVNRRSSLGVKIIVVNGTVDADHDYSVKANWGGDDAFIKSEEASPWEKFAVKRMRFGVGDVIAIRIAPVIGSKVNKDDTAQITIKIKSKKDNKIVAQGSIQVKAPPLTWPIQVESVSSSSAVTKTPVSKKSYLSAAAAAAAPVKKAPPKRFTPAIAEKRERRRTRLFGEDDDEIDEEEEEEDVHPLPKRSRPGLTELLDDREKEMKRFAYFRKCLDLSRARLALREREISAELQRYGLQAQVFPASAQEAPAPAPAVQSSSSSSSSAAAAAALPRLPFTTNFHFGSGKL